MLPQLKSLLNNHANHTEILLSERPMHAAELSKEISNNSNGIIVSVGGDGTLNEIINGLNLEKENVIGVLPIGSGNDFIKNIGLSKIFSKDLDLVLGGNKAKYKNVDLGFVEYKKRGSDEIKTRVFSNAVGIGFDAQVAHLNQTNKKLSGLISYINAVFRSLKTLRLLDVSLKFNDMHIKGHKLLITIGNGTCSGGGFYLNPNAIVDDELLDITVIEPISKIKLLVELPKVLFNKLSSIKEAVMYKTEFAEINLSEPAFVHTDGESLGDDIVSLNVKILKGKLKFISG